jgi:hypothetical protein
MITFPGNKPVYYHPCLEFRHPSMMIVTDKPPVPFPQSRLAAISVLLLFFLYFLIVDTGGNLI